MTVATFAGLLERRKYIGIVETAIPVGIIYDCANADRRLKGLDKLVCGGE